MIKKIIKKIPLAKTLLKFLYKNIRFLYNYPAFLKEFFTFKSLTKDDRFIVKFSENRAMLKEKTKNTSFDPSYTYHPAWAARILSETKPEKHIDISSLIEFSTMLSAFIPVDFYDFRPVNIKLHNLFCKQANLTSLHFENDSINSLSCMHTVEHIGLGRYGDEIDPVGDIKAMKELERVLAPGGNLLFVVPIGKPKIEFNAHRIYSYSQVISSFSSLKLKEFSLIPDDGLKEGIIINATEEQSNNQNYGCGCFWFTK